MPTDDTTKALALRRRAMLAAGGLAALGFAAGAEPTAARAEDETAAADVVVFCEPTLRAGLRAAGALYRQRTGVPVRLFASPTPLILQQVARGLRSDLLVIEADPAALQDAVARKLVRPEPDPSMTGWRNRLVVGAAAPVATPAPLAQALAGPGQVAMVDAAVDAAGARTAQALEAAGLLDAVQHHSIGTANTEDARFLLATGEARVAILYATDLPGYPALAIAATIPPDTYQPVGYGIAVVHNAASVNTRAFADFLRTDDAQAVLRTAGLEISA